MSQILIKDAYLLKMTDNLAGGEIGDILIEDNVIKKVGKITEDISKAEIIDGKNTVALPGLINCHTHAAMVLLRGYADDMELMPWLEAKIWPREAKLKEEHIYWGTMLACLEMIKSGTTTFADMYFFMDQIAQATVDSGMRGVLSRGISDSSGNGDKSLQESEDFIKNWRDKSRITCMLGPHAPYTCSDDYLQRVIDLAKDLQVGIHIHLAETKQEYSDIKEKYGKSPLAHMEDLGLFSVPVLAAHCVHLVEEDIKILQKYNVGVAHNPESNMKLASGIAPIPQMLTEGVRVGLGTDGASSNNNLNMMEEMHMAALLHKVNTGNPTVLPAYQVLEMATIKGAQVLGLEKEIGTLEAGKKADIILVDLDKSHLYPRHDIVANLIYSAQASDIKTTIIDGKIVMKNREVLTMDEEKIMYEGEKFAKSLMID